MSDLEPCPFCSGDRVIVWSIDDGVMQVACKDCKATGERVTRRDDESPEDNWKRAVEKWNCRPELKRAEAAEARLSIAMEGLRKIANGEGTYGAQAHEYKQIARAALGGDDD